MPFWLTNGVRIIFFIIFFHLLFGLLFRIENFVIYHHLNFFKLYDWTLAPLALVLLPFLLAVSLVVYRPFCQFICPFGLYSWFLENLSLYRVRVTLSLCTDCGTCVRKCPTKAMDGRLNYRRNHFLPDCWACGACIEACPTDAIVFSRKPTAASAEREEAPETIRDGV
jgi:ferredoxin